MIKKLRLIFILSAILFINGSVLAQSFGFGCLGFVGGYGGFSYQQYKATGFNDYITFFNSALSDSITAPIGSFKEAQGYRVGINFFRADLSGLILTTKGFYQSLSEKKHAALESDYGSSSIDFELKFVNWGLGVDLGTAITSALSWKVIDATVMFNNITFTDTRNFPHSITEVYTYKNKSKTSLGYSIGTGFILQVIPSYVSIEGNVGYTVFSVDQVYMNDTPLLSEGVNKQSKKFIESGGLNAVLQLNIGFPL